MTLDVVLLDRVLRVDCLLESIHKAAAVRHDVGYLVMRHHLALVVSVEVRGRFILADRFLCLIEVDFVAHVFRHV